MVVHFLQTISKIVEELEIILNIKNNADSVLCYEWNIRYVVGFVINWSLFLFRIHLTFTLRKRENLHKKIVIFI